MQNKLKYIYLNTRDEFFKVDYSKIVYFEADGNYTKFVLKNKLKGVVCMNLSHMTKVLSDSLKENASIFVRIGKRFIVNLNYVFHIEILQQKLTLSDGETFVFQLPVSKEALKTLKDMYIRALCSNTPEQSASDNSDNKEE